MSIFRRSLREVRCRTWTTGDGFVFPELQDAALGVSTRPNVGVAISGGGTRSAAAAVGQLRVLHDLGLLRKLRYLSCVSGSSWTCVPYTFLRRPHSDESFLGAVIEPEELTLEALDRPATGSFTDAVERTVILDDLLEHAARLAGDETFSRALGEIFLKPFGIDSLQRFFTLNQDTRQAAIDANPELRGEDFYPAKHNRPFLITGGTLLRAPGFSKARMYQVEMTPLYTGIYQDHGEVGAGGQPIGGGYVESFGFDSEARNEPPDAAGRLRLRLGAGRHRFTLSDVIGMSGAAPANVLTSLNLTWLGMPEFRYWPVADAHRGQARTVEYNFSDGGNLENLAVIPLLLRKVPKIIAFINTKHRLNSEDDVNTSLRNLFGQDEWQHNHVFHKNQYLPLIRELIRKNRAGEPAVHHDTFQVVRNENFGVEPGEVEILWIYNEMVGRWKDALRPEVRAQIGAGELGTFPHLKTFLQNFPKIIDLTARQASLLGHLSWWVARESQALIRQMWE